MNVGVDMEDRDMRDYKMPDGSIECPLIMPGEFKDADSRFTAGVVHEREASIKARGGVLWYGFDYETQQRIKDGVAV